MTGAVLEERIISHGGYSVRPVEDDNWKIVQGDLDPHNDVAEVMGYRSRLLPRAQFRFGPDGARFMTSSTSWLESVPVRMPRPASSGCRSAVKFRRAR